MVAKARLCIRMHECNHDAFACAHPVYMYILYMCVCECLLYYSFHKQSGLNLWSFFYLCDVFCNPFCNSAYIFNTFSHVHIPYMQVCSSYTSLPIKLCKNTFLSKPFMYLLVAYHQDHFYTYWSQSNYNYLPF